MDDLSLIQWLAGGAATLILGGLGHLHVRTLRLENQMARVREEARGAADVSIDELWAAREKDGQRREDDLKEMTKFREFVLTHLATKEDVNALEVRIATAVRMIVNERLRRGKTSGEMEE